jgi:hypothetical protein
LSEKQKFEDLLEEVRSDFALLKGLFSILTNELYSEVISSSVLDDTSAEKVKLWVFDTFLDKFFEIDAKVQRIVKDLASDSIVAFDCYADRIVERSQKVAQCIGTAKFSQIDKKIGKQKEKELNLDFVNIGFTIKDYANAFEVEMSKARRRMYQNNWLEMKPLKVEDYLLPTKRKKFVTAREEIGKAKEAVNDSRWEEVFNHLRPAIELALMEKFGFKKIHPMHNFIQCAEKEHLTLPAYTLLYEYYSEGNQRIHGGKLNTPFECKEALKFVARFVDQLDLIDIPKEKIEEFKQKCKCVE